MDVSHVSTLRVAFTPAHIQLTCDGVYLALPKTRTVIGVWSLQDLSYKPLELVGHGKTLTALALGYVALNKLLVSAADDYVIVWDLQKARQQVEKGEKVRGRVIGTTLGYVRYCALSPDDSKVAVCTGYEIVILLTQRECKVAVLEGHDGPVTAAEFCPHYTATLVSISEDRTFKVWNVCDLTLVYQSPILTASPFLSMAMSLHDPRVAIGAADGMVRVIDLTDGNDFRCLHQVDANKIVTKEQENRYLAQAEIKKGPVKVSSRVPWRQTGRFSEGQDEVGSGPLVEAGSSVLGLYFTYVHQDSRQTSAQSRDLPFLQTKTSVVSDLLTDSPMLLVGTTAGLVRVNARSLDACQYIDLQDPICCTSSLESDNKVFNAAGSIIFGQGANQQMWCVIGSPFENVVHVLKWNQSKEKERVSSLTKSHDPSHDLSLEDGLSGDRSVGSPPSRASSVQKQPDLSVLSKASLLDDSPLRADITSKQKENKERRPREYVSPTKKGVIKDNQPLTFKTKIKSSGYTTQPRTTMFQPQTIFNGKSRTPVKSSPKPRPVQEYPVQGSPPQHLTLKENVAERPTAVSAIAVSDEGSHLACALANKSALVFSLPISKKGCSAYTGHNHVVSDVCWSQCGSRLITSSEDKTARVWVKGQSEPVLVFDRVLKNTRSERKENPLFSKEIHFAKFYFMDKFILLSSVNTLYMYKYFIDLNKNDIQRYLVQSKYKLVQSWNMDSQQVTAMTAVNSFLSYIVLCACSNKSIELFDMNVGQQVRKMTDVHSRLVHAVCQNEGSQYVSHPSGAYDLFASAAAGDCIKLWDLRTNRCVRRYEGHLNRVHPCGLAFSPCGRFIATGSEDKCSYIFDMRSGTYLHKLQGQTDVVSDVAFHPLNPQLFTSSLDGRIALYNNR
ncbi:WD repeat-containing protein 27-like isoform X3 [Dreissena polymorpha]|nr:WD repeat-containing protein 27-like isoform X3 [Dreissena polymorpha]XP_052273879.1 WD repeat-containing protein 27-like isoform X3 [Dreissena polymorpha]